MSDQGSNAAAQAEIPYIPPTERQPVLDVDPNGDDSIVVVGQRQKKRKRKDMMHEKHDLPVATDSVRPKADPVEAFDFDSVPNILDGPPPVALPAKKKRREKGANVFSRWKAHAWNLHYTFLRFIDVRSQIWWYPVWQFWGPAAKYERDEKWKSISHLPMMERAIVSSSRYW